MTQESKKKKPRLRDVSRLHPTDEEAERLRAKIAAKDAPPIVVAIVGQAIVEVELERQLRECFRRKDEKTWLQLTDEVSSPLATFSQKISAGYAFGLYDNIVRSWLDSIRAIRNTFAHAKTDISFKNEAVLEELHTLSLPQNPRAKLYKYISVLGRDDQDPQQAYIGLCFIVLLQLKARQLRLFKAKTGAKLRRKERRVSAFEQGLRAAQAHPASGLAWFLASQSVDPTSLIHQPTVLEEALEAIERARKKGK